MSDSKVTRLSKIAREFNIGISTIVDFLHHKGIMVDTNPNTKITPEQYELIINEFSTDLDVKKESEKIDFKHLRNKQESVSINDFNNDGEVEAELADDQEELMIKDHSPQKVFETDSEKEAKEKEIKLNILGKIDLDKKKVKKEEPEKKEKEDITIRTTNIPEEILKKELIDEDELLEDVDLEVDEDEFFDDEDEFISNKGKSEMEVKVIGKIDLESMNQRTRPLRKTKEQKDVEKKARIEARKKEKTKEPDKEKVIGAREVSESKADFKKKRKRITVDKEKVKFSKDEGEVKEVDKDGQKKRKRKKGYNRPEVSEEEVQKQIKDTLARLTTKGKSKGSKYRREKRDAASQKIQEEAQKHAADKQTIKVTEFVSVNELASMMNVPPIDVISTCMSLGLFVSINQRLDAETMALVADEFNYKVEFISVEVQEAIKIQEDPPGSLKERYPIVTVMGHVDHGKTKLLDYIRNTNVIDGEAGGITQHIGAYSVKLQNNKRITFLDTPGHEAFTAMRARGAQITDVAIIVVAADDGVKPQTIEAINHAQAAGVPMVFAINKIDKPTANPEKIKEGLAKMNILVEDWGGKYQSQEISAKGGINIEDLLEKVLLEAELLELKANPDKNALGTVIESSLDKGRGYVATVLVQGGTLRIGDIVLAGSHTGRIKAMFNERGQSIKEAGPSSPVLVLGLDGAPQAGDNFNVMDNDKEARDIANKREQLQREQGIRTQKHITLDEIGRRIAIGNFQELNIIVKADFDGSVEALSDSLIKLSTEEIQVNIIHKAVGQISEGDVLLAAASNAIIIGFQVRPSMAARKLAEKEEIDVRLYSIIYDAIEQIKAAMEGMLSPVVKEEIVATLEIQEVFKITKVGTVAGCIVKEGKIKRNTKIRIIRDGIVIYTGLLGSLKRFKDDAKEVVSGLECGLNIENFNDIKIGDIIEGYEEFEVKKKL